MCAQELGRVTVIEHSMSSRVFCCFFFVAVTLLICAFAMARSTSEFSEMMTGFSSTPFASVRCVGVNQIRQGFYLRYGCVSMRCPHDCVLSFCQGAQGNANLCALARKNVPNSTISLGWTNWCSVSLCARGGSGVGLRRHGQSFKMKSAV